MFGVRLSVSVIFVMINEYFFNNFIGRSAKMLVVLHKRFSWNLINLRNYWLFPKSKSFIKDQLKSSRKFDNLYTNDTTANRFI